MFLACPSTNSSTSSFVAPGALPSLLESQARFDAAATAATGSNEPINKLALSHVLPGNIRVASTLPDINSVITALRTHLAALPQEHRVIGLDCEWRVTLNDGGFVVSNDRLATIQIAYELAGDLTKTIILQVHKLRALPPSLKLLLEDKTIRYAGVNVGGDLNTIGRDLNCINTIEAIPGSNVVNLGKFARRRDVVQNGTVGLDVLAEIVLNEHLAKPNAVRFSNWATNRLSTDQVRYAAIDADVSFRLYKSLNKMPDLNARLKTSEVSDGLAVDIVPRNGSAANMATRAGWGKIDDSGGLWSTPMNITPDVVRAGRGRLGRERTVKVNVEAVTASHLVVPNVLTADGSKATLGDLGEAPFQVVVPISMLRHRVSSENIRNSEPETAAPRVDAVAGVPPPAVAASPATNPSVPRTSPSTEGEDDDGCDGSADDGCDGSADDLMQTLTAEDIENIRAATNDANSATSAPPGTIPLQCPHLDPPPDPSAITDRYSSVVGDGFHLIDRPKVPIKHELKKAYKVALQEALFAWNPVKLEALKQAMVSDGLAKDEVDAEMYYNVKAFRSVVDRRILPPRQLYWRIRAVFVQFGNQVDSKTKKPLFGKEAWKKANNILKEILLGYYSDPPGVSFYYFKTNKKGEVMKNKYGFEMLECNRGTNRTEAIHKAILTIFGTWHTGVEMSDCLLAEMRHRLNHRCSEMRRLDFPKIGHYDTWLVDALQILVMNNHGTLLYPGWTNASDFKDTNERFGTVALHDEALAAAVTEASKRIIQKEKDADKHKIDIERVKLTRDQRHIAKATGADLPFLPFPSSRQGEQENKLFSRLILQSRLNDDEMAIEWTKHVDGIHIFPKLPVHIRLHREEWERNQRIRDALEKNKAGKDKLRELNAATNAPPNNTSKSSNTVGGGEAETIATATIGIAADRCPDIPMRWVPPQMPTIMQAPQAQARIDCPSIIVGGTRIGLVTEDEIQRGESKRKRGERGKDAKSRNKRRCKNCLEHEPNEEERDPDCKGRGGKKYCQYFDEAGNAK